MGPRLRTGQCQTSSHPETGRNIRWRRLFAETRGRDGIMKERTGLTDVFDVPTLELLGLSHDSKFLVALSNRENVPHAYQVRLSDPDKWVDLTSGENRVFTGKLSSDDSRFLFPLEDAGNEKHNLYVTDLESSKTSLLIKLESIRVFGAYWTPDDRSVLFDGSSASSMALRRYNLSREETDIVYETERMSAIGFVNPKKPLVTYDEQQANHPTAMDIKVINYEAAEVVETISEGETSRDYGLAWNTDGSKLLFWTNAPGSPTLAVWDMKNSDVTYSQATKLGLGIDYEIADWIPDSEDIVYAAKLNGETRMFRENVFDSEKPIELPMHRGCVSGIKTDKHNPSQLFVAWSNAANPTIIGRYDVSSGEFKPILDSRPQGLTASLSEAEFLRYPTFDDWKIPAFEVPASSDVPKLTGNPIIMLVHGGPWWEFANSWDTMGNVIQAYSGAGFRVFCPNIRGSTGYGDEYMFCNVGDLGGNDMKDILQARRYLAEKYPDTKKFFLTGAS